MVTIANRVYKQKLSHSINIMSSPTEDDLTFAQQEVSYILKKFNEEQDEYGNAPQDLVNEVVKVYKDYQSALGNVQNAAAFNEARATFASRITPLVTRNHQLPEGEQIHFRSMSSVDISVPWHASPVPTSYIGRRAPLPPGLDDWFRTKPTGGSTKDLNGYVNQIKNALLKDAAVMTSTSEYKKFIGMIDDFLRNTASGKVSDALSQHHYRQLEKTYKESKQDMYSLGSQLGSSRHSSPDPWSEPKRASDDGLGRPTAPTTTTPRRSGRRLSRKQIEDEKAAIAQEEKRIEERRRQLQADIHYSYVYTSPGGTEAVRGPNPFSPSRSSPQSPPFLGRIGDATFRAPERGSSGSPVRRGGSAARGAAHAGGRDEDDDEDSDEDMESPFG
jgi:hypothetical protein